MLTLLLFTFWNRPAVYDTKHEIHYTSKICIKHSTELVFPPFTPFSVQLSMKKERPFTMEKSSLFGLGCTFGFSYLFLFLINNKMKEKAKQRKRTKNSGKKILSINILGLLSTPSVVFVQFDRKNLLILAQVKNFIHYEKYITKVLFSFFLNTNKIFFIPIINFKETSVPTFVLIASVQILAELSGGLLSYIIT